MSTARQLILYVIYFVVVVVLGAAIIVAFTGSNPTKKPIAKAPITQHDTKNPTKPSNSPSQAQPAPASPTTKASGESVKTAIAAANPPAQLTNTGPGATAAIFVVSTVAGSLVYRRYQLRRLS